MVIVTNLAVRPVSFPHLNLIETESIQAFSIWHPSSKSFTTLFKKQIGVIKTTFFFVHVKAGTGSVMMSA